MVKKVMPLFKIHVAVFIITFEYFKKAVGLRIFIFVNYKVTS